MRGFPRAVRVLSNGSGQTKTMLKSYVFAIPVLGWMIRSAWYGDALEKAFFVVNVLAIWGFAIYLIGYAALIVPLLVATGLYLVTMVILTAGDFLTKA